MKKIMVFIMFLGLATTAFAQRGGTHGGGGGQSMRASGGRAFTGGGGVAYSGSFSSRSNGRAYYNGGFRGGYGYGYRGYGYRPWGVGVGFYSSPWVYGGGYYRPFCDPAWGPCYYPPAPYAYGRPGIAVSIGVGGGWRRFGRR